MPRPEASSVIARSEAAMTQLLASREAATLGGRRGGTWGERGAARAEVQVTCYPSPIADGGAAGRLGTAVNLQSHEAGVREGRQRPRQVAMPLEALHRWPTWATSYST